MNTVSPDVSYIHTKHHLVSVLQVTHQALNLLQSICVIIRCKVTAVCEFILYNVGQMELSFMSNCYKSLLKNNNELLWGIEILLELGTKNTWLKLDV